MPVQFEWDEDKARRNVAKHGIPFEEAVTVFDDVLSLSIPDPSHSDNEERFVLLGSSVNRRLIVVVHTERGDTFRIISARIATRRERQNYEEGYEQH